MPLLDSPLKDIVAAVLLLGGVPFAVRGTRRLRRGLARAGSLDVIRGLRGWVVAAAMASLALGVLTGERGFLVFGAVFLAEELYETGLVALVIRAGERAVADDYREAPIRSARMPTDSA